MNGLNLFIYLLGSVSTFDSVFGHDHVHQTLEATALMNFIDRDAVVGLKRKTAFTRLLRRTDCQKLSNYKHLRSGVVRSDEVAEKCAKFKRNQMKNNKIYNNIQLIHKYSSHKSPSREKVLFSRFRHFNWRGARTIFEFFFKTPTNIICLFYKNVIFCVIHFLLKLKIFTFMCVFAFL